MGEEHQSSLISFSALFSSRALIAPSYLCASWKDRLVVSALDVDPSKLNLSPFGVKREHVAPKAPGSQCVMFWPMEGPEGHNSVRSTMKISSVRSEKRAKSGFKMSADRSWVWLMTQKASRFDHQEKNSLPLQSSCTLCLQKCARNDFEKGHPSKSLGVARAVE